MKPFASLEEAEKLKYKAKVEKLKYESSLRIMRQTSTSTSTP